MLRILARIGIIVALIGAGLLAGLGYGHLQIQKEQHSSQAKINEANKKLAQFQKKASEEREAKATADSHNRTLQGEAEKLRNDNGLLAEQVKKFEGDMQACAAGQVETAEQLTRMKAARDELSGQLVQVVQIAKDLEAQVKLLTTGKNTLETSLGKINSDLDACRTHNARLCDISDELVKGQAKGVSLFHKEPFTQIQKVELEKIEQEYKDKIDSEKLSNK